MFKAPHPGRLDAVTQLAEWLALAQDHRYTGIVYILEPIDLSDLALSQHMDIERVSELQVYSQDHSWILRAPIQTVINCKRCIRLFESRNVDNGSEIE